MNRTKTAIGGVASVLGGPGVVAGLLPYLITRWRSTHPTVVLIILGAFLIGIGLRVLLRAASRFIFEGRGTIAPWAPTDRLIVTGPYRYVRNPMYVAVLAILVGEALVLGRPVLGIYAAGFWVIVAAFVRLYEEPELKRNYGEEFDAYRRGVRAWVPRLRPWSVGD